MPLDMFEEALDYNVGHFWNETVFLVPASIGLVLLLVMLFCAIFVYKKKR